MHPFAILKRTPKTNCGRCGYPTCLAFAAAVSRNGEKISACPYLDASQWPESPPEPPPGEDERSSALIAHLRQTVASLDFSRLADRLGALWSADEPDSLFFSYIGRQVRLSKTGVLLDGCQPEDHRDQILLYNYVRSGGGRPPDGTWVGMESLPNSISKIRTLAVYCEERLAAVLSRKGISALEEAGRRLGAQPDSQGASGQGLVFPVLPRVPQYLLFWEPSPEDGFEARVKILFDHHVLDFLDLESLVFSAERLTEWLLPLIELHQPVSSKGHGR